MNAMTVVVFKGAADQVAREAINASQEYWRWWFSMIGVTTRWMVWKQ